ncbi:MAG TPA: hypothetical protein VEI24_03640 [Nitrospiria bacterium]|nr:hypothetical protein [Nitrospiria bacterium]
MTRLATAGVSLAMIWLLCSWGEPAAHAAAPTHSPPATAPAKPQSGEPSHRVMLLGSTIYGAVLAPAAVYDVPWQEPFSLEKGAGELDRNFLQEIFQPVDRDEFLKQSSPQRSKESQGP